MPDEPIREALTNYDDPDPPAEDSPPRWKGNLVESIRLRPGMFIGDMRDGYGLHELLNTVFRWAVEQHVAGRCTELDVMIDLTGGARVTMTGVRVEFREIEPLLFGTRRDLNLVTVTALSTIVSLASVPEIGARFEYTAVNGKAQGVEPFVDESPVRTKIHFAPDAAFFGGSSFDYERVETRLREIAALNDGLRVTFMDWRSRRGMELPVPRPLGRFYFVDRLRGSSASLPGEAGEGWIISGEAPAGADGIAVVVALAWVTEGAPNGPVIRSFVNQYETKDGGHHASGLVRGALTCVLKRIDRAEKLTDERRAQTTRWLKSRLIGFVAVTHPNPSFGSATRSVLIAPEVAPIVRNEVHRALDAYFDQRPEEIARIVADVLTDQR